MNSILTCGLTNKLHETIFRSIMTKLGRRHVINASDIKNDLLCKKNYDNNKIAVYIPRSSFFHLKF